MATFAKHIPGFYRTIESGKCVDFPVQIRVKDGRVSLLDCRKLKRRTIYDVIPTEVSLYEVRNAIPARGNKVLISSDGIFRPLMKSVWELFIRSEDGLFYVRIHDEFTAKRGEKHVRKAIENHS